MDVCCSVLEYPVVKASFCVKRNARKATRFLARSENVGIVYGVLAMRYFRAKVLTNNNSRPYAPYANALNCFYMQARMRACSKIRVRLTLPSVVGIGVGHG